ncbi:MAG: hypothetical protein IT167_18635 [Bryobacterales bacterium]|nr:hypothetical protein [Bryobacterales bacterium]
MFVSTALELWWTDRPEMFARDFQIDDTVYRRLDAEYFAWLRAKMIAAKEAAVSGRIPLAAFNDLRLRFNAIQEWAVGRFGEVALLEAARCIPSDYRPPVASLGTRLLTLPPRKRNNVRLPWRWWTRYETGPSHSAGNTMRSIVCHRIGGAHSYLAVASFAISAMVGESGRSHVSRLRSSARRPLKSGSASTIPMSNSPGFAESNPGRNDLEL